MNIKAVAAVCGHSFFIPFPCGNRKFTEPMPDDKMRLYFRAKYRRVENFRADGKRQGGSLPIDVCAGRTGNQRIM